MTTMAFVQARMGSTRLPGKVLEPLGGEPALAQIIQRVKRTAGLDALAVLTSDRPADEPVRQLAAAEDVPCVAGSELDVLDRFQRGVEELGAELIVRVTADCPLIDPGVLAELLVLRRETDADHAAIATGALPADSGYRRYPDGLDGEVFTAEALASAWREARDPYEREHVTPFLYRRPKRFQLAVLEAPVDLGHERWTVDYPEDLEFARAVYDRLQDAPSFGWQDVRRVLESEPTLRELNDNVRSDDH